MTYDEFTTIQLDDIIRYIGDDENYGQLGKVYGFDLDEKNSDPYMQEIFVRDGDGEMSIFIQDYEIFQKAVK